MVHYRVTEISTLLSIIKEKNIMKRGFSQNITFRRSNDRLIGMWRKEEQPRLIENKVAEVSRVYPTENLFDLFKQFPDGFKVEQVYIKRGTYLIEMSLQGDSSNHTISGVLTKTRASEDITEKPEETIRVDYIDGKFIFSDKEKAERIMDFDGFLFQELTINQSFLSSLSMKSKSYNGNNGALRY